MDESELASSVIGKIYDAALDPVLWPEVLEAACSFVGGSAGALVSFDLLRSQTAMELSSGYDPDYLKLYDEHYKFINPLVEASLWAPVGEVQLVTDWMSYEDFTAHPFYQEWAKPHGFVDGYQVNLDRSASSMAALAVIRHERHGRADFKSRRQLALLAPHVRRALLIAKAIDLRRIEVATFAEALNSLPIAVFLVDAGGYIVHSNAAGRALVEAQDCVVSANGLLMPVERQLWQVLSGAFAACDRGGSVGDSMNVALTLPGRSGAKYVAQVLSLTSGRRHPAAVQVAAVAAFFIRRASLDLNSAVGRLCPLFGLTVGEARVLHGLAGGSGAPVIAAQLGVSVDTVKTHLRHIFEKTGVNSQTELVRLMADFADPAAT